LLISNWESIGNQLGDALYYKGEKYESEVSNPGDFHGEGDKIRKELAKRIFPKDGFKVLDVGTGFGINAGFLANIIHKKGRIWTLDPSEEALKNAEKSLREKGLADNMTFVNGTTEKLPFENNFFDMVVSVVVLHHLQGLEGGISEMLRVLKKRGKIVLVDWNGESNVLPFSSRHKKEDFFAPEVVALLIKNRGALPTTTEFQYWYIVEAVK
jgi:demethylmenaquinone methyltransferase / 2-methoxy-6-polyprenyl-1,4-benzoquinol methylase